MPLMLGIWTLAGCHGTCPAFQLVGQLPVGHEPNAVVAADLDGDGKPESVGTPPGWRRRI